MKDVLLIKYGEIAMRGNNRHIVENRLIKTIAANLKSAGNYWIEKEQGRFVVESRNENGEFDFETVIPLSVNVFGVTAVCPGIMFEDNSLESLKEKALEHIKKHYPAGGISFKVCARRSDKRYPLSSGEICAQVGRHILENVENVKVDVHNPDVKVMVELRNHSYVYSKIIYGFGGLPVGSSGKATVLMSGGIDSPVAAFMTAKRGVEIEAVYFESPPYTSERAKQKVIDLAKRISVFTGGMKLYVIPFTEIQCRIYDVIPIEKTTIILKRAMIKCAEKIALKNGSQALVTGDSIGQVASQTMHAIESISSAAEKLPILRPLCGMDKQEIVDMAVKIGTYDISIRPYEDCCTIFVAKHPETKPKRILIEKIERRIENIDEMAEKAANDAEVLEI